MAQYDNSMVLYSSVWLSMWTLWLIMTQYENSSPLYGSVWEHYVSDSKAYCVRSGAAVCMNGWLKHFIAVESSFDNPKNSLKFTLFLSIKIMLFSNSMVLWLFGEHSTVHNRGLESGLERNAMNNYGDKGIGEDKGSSHWWFCQGDRLQIILTFWRHKENTKSVECCRNRVLVMCNNDNSVCA